MTSFAERRRTIRSICDVLRSDLYKRDGGQEGIARWESPLHWVVLYGYTDDTASVWCEIVHPNGTSYARTEDGDAEWLERHLP